MTTLKIKRFTINNFRGVKHFEAAPEGKSLLLKGANGTGKTSVLNAIIFAFSGSVFSGMATNLQRDNAEPFSIEVDFLVDRNKHVIKINAKPSGKIEYALDGVIYEQKSRYLQALADLINLDDYNLFIDLLYPSYIESSIGAQSNLATKQLREAFIRAINAKEIVFDNDGYLDLKTQILHKEETKKLLEKEFRIEEEFARKFRAEHRLSEIARDTEIVLQERTTLEANLNQLETRESLRNKLEGINARLKDLEMKLDPANNELLVNKAKIKRPSDYALLAASMGTYWSTLKRRQNHDANVLNEEIREHEADYEKLKEEKTQVLLSLNEIPNTAEINLENLKTRIRQLDTQTSEVSRNRERYQQIVSENKEVREQINELDTEIKLLKVEKAKRDAAILQGANKLLPDHMSVALFNDNNEEVIDVLVDNVHYEDLNTGEQVRIASYINSMMSNDLGVHAFSIVDRFETLSHFQADTQIIAGLVSVDKTLQASEVNYDD